MPIPAKPVPEMEDIDIDVELENFEGEEEPESNVEGEVTMPAVPEVEKIDPDGAIGVEKDEDVKPFKTFATEEEYTNYIDSERKKAVELARTPEPQKEIELEGPVKYFEEDFKPEDWNDQTDKFVKNPKVREALVKELAPGIRKALEKERQKEIEENKNLNKEFDDEYKEIAKKGLLPNLSSDEGQLINKQISKVGADYGVGTISKAYKIWAMIPEKEGGGLEYTVKKGKMATKKAQSSLIGSSRKGVTTQSTKKDSHEHVTNTDMDELIQEELEDE